MEKQNPTEQKHTFTNQKTTQKTKARFSRLQQDPAWKWRAPILVSVPHKFVTYLLRHLPTNLETRDPHGTTGWVTGTASSPYKTQ